MTCSSQLDKVICLLLLLLDAGFGQNDSVAVSPPGFLTTCLESCPWNNGQTVPGISTGDWCSHMDFTEPPYQTELPQCKNITVNHTDFIINAKNNLVLQKNGFTASYSKYRLANDSRTANICYYLSPQLQHCNLKLLDNRVYAFDQSLLALKNCKTGAIIALGDFYPIPGTSVVVGCRESFGHDIGLKIRCEYITLSITEYEFLGGNSTIRLLSTNHIIQNALYSFSGNSSSIRMCFPLSAEMTKCDRIKLLHYEYRMENDRSVYVLKNGIHLKLGEYQSDAMKEVQYCKPVDIHTPTTYYVYFYCHVIQLISALLIILAVVIHLAFPSINYHAKPLICQMVSMAVFYIAGASRYLWYPDTEAACYVVFVFFYFSALTSFFWLNVLSFDMWSIFANLQTSSMHMCANMCDRRPKFLLYCIYAYSIPLIMTILSVVLETQPSMQEALNLRPDIGASCWFTEAKSLYLFYSGPVFFLLCFNMVLFGLTVWNLRRASDGVKMVNKKRNKQLFFVCLKIFVIMGLCWTTEFIVFLADGSGEATYPAVIAVSIQGILLFIIYICKPSTYRILRRKMAGTISHVTRTPKDVNSSKVTGHTNSSTSGISMESIIPDENLVIEGTPENEPAGQSVQNATML